METGRAQADRIARADMACVGAILAGGKSSRFGSGHKGLATVGGKRLLDRVRDAVEPATDSLLLIANDTQAHEWLPGIEVVADREPGSGTLGGLYTALSHAARPVLLVGWDMPFLKTDLLLAIRLLGETGYDAVLAESGSGHGLEPLAAWYAPACTAAIERAISRGDRRMIGFLEDVRLTTLGIDEVKRFGDPERLFLNVNTPADLTRAEMLDVGR